MDSPMDMAYTNTIYDKHNNADNNEDEEIFDNMRLSAGILKY